MKRKCGGRSETIVMDLVRRYRRRNTLCDRERGGGGGEAKSNFVIAPG